jgi:transcriptional regulator with XRE-family HTH domain
MSETPSLSQLVGRRTREIRLARGLSQEDLAQLLRESGLLGWSRPVVNGLERGTRELEVGELIGLAVVLEVSLPELVGNDLEWVQIGELLEIRGPGLSEYLRGGEPLREHNFRSPAVSDETRAWGDEDSRLFSFMQLPIERVPRYDDPWVFNKGLGAHPLRSLLLLPLATDRETPKRLAWWKPLRKHLVARMGSGKTEVILRSLLRELESDEAWFEVAEKLKSQDLERIDYWFSSLERSLDVAELGELEMYAARQLDVSPREVALACWFLWGLPATTVRNQRAADNPAAKQHRSREIVRDLALFFSHKPQADFILVGSDGEVRLIEIKTATT